MPVTADPFFVPQRFFESVAEGDADVFDQMMIINFNVPLGGDLKIKHPMLGKGFEHVV